MPQSHPATQIHSTITQDAGFATGQLIPGPGAFVFNGTASFITLSTISYFQMIPGGQCWMEMVKSYLELKQLPMQKGVHPLFLISFILANYINLVFPLPPNNFQAK